MRVDWLNATVEERKALYRVARAIADQADTNILGVVAQATGNYGVRGAGYETNFNHGTIGRKTAKMIAQWIEENHRDLAHATEPEIFPISASTIWGEYLADHGITGQLHVQPKSRARDLVTFETEATEGHNVLALGEPFTLELNASRSGFCMGYQVYREKWYGFPLSKTQHWLRKQGTQIALPQMENGDPAHIIERQHDDMHHFVIVIADQVEEDFISKAPDAYESGSFELHHVSVEFREHG
ncbi:hypothetical protein [Thalassobius sp. I31.1]|uniref:hypothetical protein n=1 Tax=Thalassobius sp. I31.1 TaxID=2109912 RepID=UPI000D1B1030|nr:hypothetical protein [Thalassobius sp. I31.1]